MDDVLAGGPGPPSGRTRGALLALAAVAVLVAVVALTRPDPPARGAAPPADRGRDAAPAVADVLGGPPRGSLADDAAFLDAVRSRPWAAEPLVGSADVPDPDVATRRVVFAGDVPGGRWVLVAGRNDVLVEGRDGTELVTEPVHEAAVAWFTGPPGAAAEEMTLRSVPAGVPAGRPVALLDPGAGALVVVAARGAVVEVSSRPMIGADASIGRTWNPVTTVDGVAVVSLGPMASPYPTAVRYRVAQPGTTVTAVVPPSVPADASATAPPAIEYPLGAPTGVGAAVAGWAADRVVAGSGLPPERLRITARWVGEVVRTAPTPAHGALVAVTMPSGAVVVSAHWFTTLEDGNSLGGSCGLAVEPAGAPVERRVHAVVCEAVDDTPSSPTRSTLVVVGPPPVTAVRAYTAGGDWLGELPAAGGVVVAPLPPGTASVEAVTDAGVLLGRTPVLTARDGVDI
ncbi:hypothetical protein OF117_01720 [Geodermatophilus sp. YIM 151500]|uniref:hypothetical protein n=1 Tax=Geodermatophilus sp. YIM 151500 TaxID=2984531 RepID=UPI0021E384C1|nr:hypothetical protein [Geodermatophilus sp. YIM 151500]MCV2488068.1 hypothetical protein [Geodermatophilus sp. YIM 151500]